MCHKGKPTLLILNMATKCYQFHIQRSMAIFQGGKERVWGFFFFGFFFFFFVKTPGGLFGGRGRPGGEPPSWECSGSRRSGPAGQ